MAVSQTSKPTRIGNQANLSWRDTKRHLEFLVSQGFVTVVKGEKERRIEYRLTKKGFEALEALRKVTGALSPKLTIQQV